MSRIVLLLVLALIGSSAILVRAAPGLVSPVQAAPGVEASDWVGEMTGAFQYCGDPPSCTSGTFTTFSANIVFSVSTTGDVQGAGLMVVPPVALPGCSSPAPAISYYVLIRGTGSSRRADLVFVFFDPSPDTFVLDCGGESTPFTSYSGSASYTISLQTGTTQTFQDCVMCFGSFPGYATDITLTNGVVYPNSYSTMSCSPNRQVVGHKANCIAAVFGDNPTGYVRFSASSKGVILGQPICALIPDYEGFSFCQTTVDSRVPGTYRIGASYAGDNYNPASAASVPVTFISPPKGRSDLNLTCTPSVVNKNITALCSASVSGTPPTPSGTVTWNSTNPVGAFSNSTCSLSGGRCAVRYFQSNDSSPATIEATYSGDGFHQPKDATATIAVPANGTGLVDQRTADGLTATVQTTPGSPVNVSSIYYYSQPNGTGTPPFESAQYLDLKVDGVTGANVGVCYTGQNVNSTTSIDYYSGGSWNSATRVSATAGSQVCGSIPTSSLKGTPLAVGDPAPLTTSTSSTLSVTSLHTLQPGQWTQIGPFGVNITAQSRLNTYGSGAVDAIGYSQSDPNLIYVSGGPFSQVINGGRGGMWKTSDGGRTWGFVNGTAGILVTAILIDPTDPNAVLVNTLKGIMKSSDGGATWTTTYGSGGYVLTQQGSAVYATSNEAVLKSMDFGSSWRAIGSVPSNVTSGGTIEAGAFANDGRTIYLGVTGETLSAQAQALLVESTDGGATFHTAVTISGASQFNSISVSQSNPDVVWLTACGTSQCKGIYQGTWRSVDGGRSWQPEGQAWQSIAVDPFDSKIVYYGYNPGLYMSTDGGATQHQVLSDIVTFGPDVRNILFVSNSTIMIGTDQGLYVTRDGGLTWSGLNGMANFMIPTNAVAVSGSTIVMSAQDYGGPLVSCDGGASWAFSPPCFRFYQTMEDELVANDPYKPSWVIFGKEPIGNVPTLGESPSSVAFSPVGDTAYAASGIYNYNQGTDRPVYKTTDGGKTWNPLPNAPLNAIGVAVSYQSPSTVYAMNSSGIYVSDDAGGSWTLEPGTGCALCIGTESLVADPANSSLVAMASEQYGFERSTQGGANMAALDFSGTSLGSGLRGVFSPDALYSYLLPNGRAALVALTGGSLYVSFDFGLSWAQVSNGLPTDSLDGFYLSSQGDGYVSTWGYGLYEFKNLTAYFDSLPVTGPMSASGKAPPSNYIGSLPLWPFLLVGVIILALVVVRHRRRNHAKLQTHELRREIENRWSNSECNGFPSD